MRPLNIPYIESVAAIACEIQARIKSNKYLGDLPYQLQELTPKGVQDGD